MSAGGAGYLGPWIPSGAPEPPPPFVLPFSAGAAVGGRQHGRSRGRADGAISAEVSLTPLCPRSPGAPRIVGVPRAPRLPGADGGGPRTRPRPSTRPGPAPRPARRGCAEKAPCLPRAADLAPRALPRGPGVPAPSVPVTDAGEQRPGTATSRNAAPPCPGGPRARGARRPWPGARPRALPPPRRAGAWAPPPKGGSGLADAAERTPFALIPWLPALVPGSLFSLPGATCLPDTAETPTGAPGHSVSRSEGSSGFREGLPRGEQFFVWVLRLWGLRRPRGAREEFGEGGPNTRARAARRQPRDFKLQQENRICSVERGFSGYCGAALGVGLKTPGFESRPLLLVPASC